MYPVAARENSEKNLMQREETTLLVAWSATEANENWVNFSMYIATKPNPSKAHSQQAKQLTPQ